MNLTAEENAIIETFKHQIDCNNDPEKDLNVIRRALLLGVAGSSKSTVIKTMTGMLNARYGAESFRVLVFTGEFCTFLLSF